MLKSYMRSGLCFRTTNLKVVFEKSRLGVWLENLEDVSQIGMIVLGGQRGSPSR